MRSENVLHTNHTSRQHRSRHTPKACTLAVLAVLVTLAGCQSVPSPKTAFFGRQPKATAKANPLQPVELASYSHGDSGKSRAVSTQSRRVDPETAIAHGLPALDPAYMPIAAPVSCDENHVISRFGPRNGRMHRGIDIKATYGSPVVATGAGTVTLAKWLRGYGRVVYVDHGGGVQTRYGHLSSFNVREGQKVRAGHELGTMGRTGNASTHHVHYEIRVGGKALNPEPFLPFKRGTELASLDVDELVSML